MRIRNVLASILFLLALLLPLEVYAEGKLHVKGTDYDVSVQKESDFPTTLIIGQNVSPVGYSLYWKGEKKSSGEIAIKSNQKGTTKFSNSFSFKAKVTPSHGHGKVTTTISGDVTTSPICVGEPKIKINKKKILSRNNLKAEIQLPPCNDIPDGDFEWRLEGPSSEDLSGKSISISPEKGKYKLILLHKGKEVDSKTFSVHKCKGKIENPRTTDSAKISDVPDRDEYDATTFTKVGCDPLLGDKIKVGVDLSHKVDYFLKSSGFTGAEPVISTVVKMEIFSGYNSFLGNDSKENSKEFDSPQDSALSETFEFSQNKNSAEVRADQDRQLRGHGSVSSRYSERGNVLKRNSTGIAKARGFDGSITPKEIASN